VSELTVFICGGRPKDHVCDSEGPLVCGGTDEDGNSWAGLETPENRRRASWGSVTCSVCGTAAIDSAMWDGP
jgi:hypothetical protein